MEIYFKWTFMYNSSFCNKTRNLNLIAVAQYKKVQRAKKMRTQKKHPVNQNYVS